MWICTNADLIFILRIQHLLVFVLLRLVGIAQDFYFDCALTDVFLWITCYFTAVSALVVGLLDVCWSPLIEEKNKTRQKIFCNINLEVAYKRLHMNDHFSTSSTHLTISTNLLKCILKNRFSQSRHLSLYGLSQWKTMLQCNVVSHWLSLYTEWYLHSYIHGIPVARSIDYQRKNLQ